jgi:hypothetical protein
MLVRRNPSSCSAALRRNVPSALSSARAFRAAKPWKCSMASLISEMSLVAVNFDSHSVRDVKMPFTPSRSV